MADVAVVPTCTVENWCVGLYQQCCAEAVCTCVDDVLTCSLTKEVLGHPEMTQVFYGLYSLDVDKKLDQYRFGIGYIAGPVWQRVAFDPWMRWLLNGVGYRMLKVTLTWWSEQASLAKAEGMTRFDLEGDERPAKRVYQGCLRHQGMGLLIP